jgi:hypothetical protein
VERGDRRYGRLRSSMWKVSAFKAIAPHVSVKDRWVGLRKQVLNVPITCRCYGPVKPIGCLSIESCLFPTASLAVVGETLGTDPLIRQSSRCGLCWEPFFLGAVDLYKSVDDFVKGCYALTT